LRKRDFDLLRGFIGHWPSLRTALPAWEAVTLYPANDGNSNADRGNDPTNQMMKSAFTSNAV
jgi:hypothetical protein